MYNVFIDKWVEFWFCVVVGKNVFITDFIRPICLHTQGFEAKDYKGYYHKVAGWNVNRSKYTDL